ncbi:LrgB family protein [Entomomonas moraniae]|uniref:LrgB family protein n=1 Tax=Entomomonas moraniae TaxID=2213226 RepID=A0A3Q9JIY4_9GAMM|nr:LrgB family protein [Entomomonas moraniae]AZS50568.1 LrgB family protein [Entomomonas moraniae]
MTIEWWKPWLWLLLTLCSYFVSRWLYKRKRYYILSPLLFVPIILFAFAVPLHTTYKEYSQNTHWLVLMLGPATVAFAVPIWKQRKLIIQHWLALSIGMLVGSSLSIISSFYLAHMLSLDDKVTMSLVPRTITTPFAMPVAETLGGVPELAAVFVLITGVLGGLLGGIILKWLPLKTTLARGAIFGVGAHGCGVSRAQELGMGEGSVAGLAMVLMGLINLIAAPLIHVIL